MKKCLILLLLLVSIGCTKKTIIVTKGVNSVVAEKESSIKKTENYEKRKQKEEEKKKKSAKSAQKSVKSTNIYRLTSYWPAETSNCTGSGKCTKDFTVNEKGWFLYKGKVVLAGATTYLQKKYGTYKGRHYFKYYDQIKITVDGKEYDAIILDSCGACMSISHEERLDLFVKDEKHSIDRGYKGQNPIQVKW